MRSASTGSPPAPDHPSTKAQSTHVFSRALGVVTLWLTILVGLGLLGCSETQHVNLNECGNRIVEQNEDCDGARGCNNACHFSCGPQTACPGGWGCDLGAGICRAARGTFAPQTLETDRFSNLLVADFDGDGRDDLFSYSPEQREPSSVLFFDRAGKLEHTVTLPAADSATLGDMTGDHAPDVVLNSDAASAFRVNGPRAFSPLIGALRDLEGGAKLLAADLDCDGLRDILLLGGAGALSESVLSRVEATGELTPLTGRLAITATQLRQLEADESDFYSLRELTATGALGGSGTAACEMLALPAPPGTLAVDVYASLDGGQSIEATARIHYDGDALAVRWFFADIDNDALADLVIVGASDSWVSHGLGNGQFEASVSPLLPLGQALTAGELDKTPGTDLFTNLNGDQAYRQARALDITGDGLEDVVAVGDQRRVDVLRGHKTGHMTQLSLPLRDLPQIEGVGDFDGDGRDDVLLSQSSTAAGVHQRASILFAPVTSDGGALLGVAEFERIEQLAAGSWTTDAQQADGSSDIGVLFSTKDEKRRLGFLEGAADRLLRSRLPTGNHEVFGSIPGAPALGRFHADAGVELAIVKAYPSFETSGAGIGPPLDPGTAPPEAEGDPITIELLKVDTGGLTYASSVTLPDFRYEQLLFVAKPPVFSLNLDGDELDELYVGSKSGVLRIDAQGESFAATLFAPGQTLLGVDAQDANGDGLADLLVMDRKQGLSVFLAVRHGDPVHHTFPPEAFDCDQLGADFTFIQADADAEQELLFNCYPSSIDLSYGIFASSEELQGAGVETRILDVDFEHSSLLRIGAVAPEVSTGLVRGDFNGDGVEDFAGGAPNLSVFFGDPR